MTGECGKHIEQRLLAMCNDNEARHLARFFKTGVGEYGEGDKFIGVRVPVTRLLVREYRHEGDIADVKRLISSEWHEVRLAGLLLLVEIYQRAVKSGDDTMAKQTVEFYLNNLDRGNNWDLVDVIAPKILGNRLLRCPEERDVLYRLAEMDGYLWHQRVAIVSTWTLIRDGEYNDTIAISERYITHRHDLIHKATGWMLREVGKRGGIFELCEFLECHAAEMPRTMLRYAIEQLPADKRKYYMLK
ncbi:MAG: DNA alkylation repair protein [Muribaculaceae bacterium]|nr:DNA alkylation repair protein [Muribaculaceae bacterium]